MLAKLTFCFGLVLLASGPTLSDAFERYAEGRPAEARAAFEAQLEEHPERARLIQFNIAQTYWAEDSFALAARYYDHLVGNLPPQTESRALNNLALYQISHSRQQAALENLKNALLRDPENELARYNYELLKRRMEQNPPPPYQPPPPEDLPPPTGSPNPPPPTEMLGSQEEEHLLSPAEADAALGRIAQRKEQYLQQLRKRSTEPARFSDKPNW